MFDWMEVVGVVAYVKNYGMDEDSRVELYLFAAHRTAPRRLAALLISVFAAIAFLLAAVGIYGVMSYAALGARREDILGMVLRSGTVMAVTGVGIGLVLALALARLITSLLFRTSAADPPTFSIVPLLLVAVAL